MNEEVKKEIAEVGSVAEKFLGLPNLRKFSVPEMFNDANGKTSEANLLVFIIGITGCVGFILSGTSTLLQIWIKSEKSFTSELSTLTTTSCAVMGLAVTYFTARRLSKDQPIQ